MLLGIRRSGKINRRTKKKKEKQVCRLPVSSENARHINSKSFCNKNYEKPLKFQWENYSTKFL